MKKLLLLIAALFVLGAVSNSGSQDKKTPTPGSTATASAPTPVSPCRRDYTQCADNADVVNNYDGMARAAVECESEAKDRAKYGSPDFPWLSFGRFYGGDSFKSDLITIIEPDAKFQNGFGAMVRSRVVCTYNLRNKKVVSLSIGER